MAADEPGQRPLLSLLTSPDEATPEWLTVILRDGGYLRQGRVTAVVHDAGSSVHARNARLQLRYSDEAQGDRPSALFLKISPTHTTNFAAPPTLAQANKTAVAMARLHAAWWNDPQLPEVGRWPETAVIDNYVQSALPGIQPLLEETRDQISDEWCRLIQLIAERHGYQMKARAADPATMTFIHGDPNPGNILSPHDE